MDSQDESGEDARGWLRPLGSTGLVVSAVSAGGAPLGSMPENFGYEVMEADAIDLVEKIFDSPVRVIDTANGYSAGRSEERIGKAIARFGGLPPDFLVATKVDADGRDYSGERVRRSVEESSRRLGLETLPLVYLHDPEYHDFGTMTAPGGAVATLVRMRDEGIIGHIGLAGGDVHEMAHYLDAADFEALLIHNRWTLVDHSAEDLVQQASSRGVAIVNAAIYGGGILAAPDGGNTSYGYREASPATLDAIARMNDLCRAAGTDLPTAALLASLADPLVDTTVIGFSKPERLNTIMAAASVRLPDGFWAELASLRPARQNWLDAR